MSERIATYVGYLPLPRGDRRFLRLAIPATLWLMCAISAAVGLSMAGQGGGTWSTETITLEGRFTMTPYAAVITDDGDGETRTSFVVDAGKVGIRDSAATLDGRRVRVTGTVLERNGDRMIELLPGDDP